MKKGESHKEETKFKISESMEGNANAEKWTEETVMPILDRIKEIANQDDCLWLGSALVQVDLYKQLWSDWSKKFADNKTVSESIKKIDQIFEDKLFTKALKGSVNGTVAIFGLKNNHDWKDKTEIDQTIKSTVAFADLTDEQVENERKRLAERLAKFGA